MIPDRMLAAKRVEAELTALACRRIARYSRSSEWATAWGFHFSVPEDGPAKLCPEDVFRRILAEIAAHRPLPS